MFTLPAFNQQDIVKDGLLFWLDANDKTSYPGTGTTWTDLSKGGNNGTLTNGPTFDTGSGGSIVFDGVDDYVFRNTYVNAGSNFSVFAWVKPGNINIRDGIVGNSYPYSEREGFFLSTATNYGGTTNTFFISVGRDLAYYTAANNSITQNIWNYIGGTVVNGGQGIKLYVNGVETSYFIGLLSSNVVTYNNNQLLIGSRNTNTPEPFAGNIAQVSIYNKILTAQEVLQNYNATKGRFGL
jgi:hypothetical protein